LPVEEWDAYEEDQTAPDDPDNWVEFSDED
jgi:hypothetical protein